MSIYLRINQEMEVAVQNQSFFNPDSCQKLDKSFIHFLFQQATQQRIKQAV